MRRAALLLLLVAVIVVAESASIGSRGDEEKQQQEGTDLNVRRTHTQTLLLVVDVSGSMALAPGADGAAASIAQLAGRAAGAGARVLVAAHAERAEVLCADAGDAQKLHACVGAALPRAQGGVRGEWGAAMRALSKALAPLWLADGEDVSVLFVGDGAAGPERHHADADLAVELRASLDVLAAGARADTRMRRAMALLVGPDSDVRGGVALSGPLPLYDFVLLERGWPDVLEYGAWLLARRMRLAMQPSVMLQQDGSVLLAEAPDAEYAPPQLSPDTARHTMQMEVLVNGGGGAAAAAEKDIDVDAAMPQWRIESDEPGRAVLRVRVPRKLIVARGKSVSVSFVRHMNNSVAAKIDARKRDPFRWKGLIDSKNKDAEFEFVCECSVDDLALVGYVDDMPVRLLSLAPGAVAMRGVIRLDYDASSVGSGQASSSVFYRYSVWVKDGRVRYWTVDERSAAVYSQHTFEQLVLPRGLADDDNNNNNNNGGGEAPGARQRKKRHSSKGSGDESNNAEVFNEWETGKLYVDQRRNAFFMFDTYTESFATSPRYALSEPRMMMTAESTGFVPWHVQDTTARAVVRMRDGRTLLRQRWIARTYASAGVHDLRAIEGVRLMLHNGFVAEDVTLTLDIAAVYHSDPRTDNQLAPSYAMHERDDGYTEVVVAIEHAHLTLYVDKLLLCVSNALPLLPYDTNAPLETGCATQTAGAEQHVVYDASAVATPLPEDVVSVADIVARMERINATALRVVFPTPSLAPGAVSALYEVAWHVASRGKRASQLGAPLPELGTDTMDADERALHRLYVMQMLMYETRDPGVFVYARRAYAKPLSVAQARTIKQTLDAQRPTHRDDESALFEGLPADTAVVHTAASVYRHGDARCKRHHPRDCAYHDHRYYDNDHTRTRGSLGLTLYSGRAWLGRGTLVGGAVLAFVVLAVLAISFRRPRGRRVQLHTEPMDAHPL